MATLKMGSTTVLTDTTLDGGITFPTGMICKHEFERTTNTGAQTGTINWVTVDGSSMEYTPQTGATNVFYQCRISRQHIDTRHISGFQVKHDGTALDYSRLGDDASANSGNENAAGWVYYDTIIPAWTGSKTTLLEFRVYNSSYRVKLHYVEYWNPSDGGVMESGAFYTPTEVTMYSIM
jgi:hypothetical protein